jgi:hypothetical protein
VVCLGTYLGTYAGVRPVQFKTEATQVKGVGVSLETFKKR